MYTLTQIADIVNGKLIGDNIPNCTIKDLLYDSRKVSAISEALFFAIKTKKNDGHNYIEQVYNKGVHFFVVNNDYLVVKSNFPDGVFIQVQDSLNALQQLAKYHRQQFDIPIIGITGSNGKTIVKEWLYQLMCDDKKIVYSPNSFNSQIGVPLSVSKITDNDQLAIFEAGISQPNEMIILQDIIKPTIGIFTNIGSAHDEAFVNIKQKVEEKLNLFHSVQTLIYCIDHEYINNTICQIVLNKKIDFFTWSRREKNANLYVKTIEKQTKTTSIVAIYQEKEISITIPFIDEAAIENAIHCWATLLLLGYENKTIAQRIAKLTPIAMRLEIKQGINRCLIINDTYNSDINSLQIAIDLMNNQQQSSKRTIILSDILQSRSSEYQLYKDVSNLLINNNINKIIGIGEAICRQADSFSIEKEFYLTTDDFFAHFNVNSLENEIILVKGARKYNFERISQYLELKTHETILEVSLEKLVSNINYYKSMLNPHVKMMAMVKAFSYGIGDIDVANVLQYHGVDYLTVAYTDEGIALREKNIKLPIMVMNPEENAMDSIIRYDLQPEIYSFRILEILLSALQRNSQMNCIRVHLKMDTGMHRLGFKEEDLQKLVNILKENPKVLVDSVFSHFAAADDAQEDDFTHTQANLLTKYHNYIANQLGYTPLKHIANTAGFCRFPQYQFDMVRVGIGLYGINPFVENGNIEEVATLKTRISQLCQVAKGETVGYNRRFKAEKDTVIATISIGYADGFPRSAGYEKTQVLVNGYLAKIVGSICMDMCMIDVTGLPVREGDEVVIFGKGLPLTHLAKSTGMIEYELLTHISQRVKRIYIEG